MTAKERIVLLPCFRPDPVTIFEIYILFNNGRQSIQNIIFVDIYEEASIIVIQIDAGPESLQDSETDSETGQITSATGKITVKRRSETDNETGQMISVLINAASQVYKTAKQVTGDKTLKQALKQVS